MIIKLCHERRTCPVKGMEHEYLYTTQKASSPPAVQIFLGVAVKLGWDTQPPCKPSRKDVPYCGNEDCSLKEFIPS